MYTLSLFQVDLFLQVSGITAGRAAAILPAVLGLISVIVGRLALARAGRVGTNKGRIGAIVTLTMALIGIVLSALHLARTTSGIGTGSGKLGAIVALVLGLFGMLLGGLAFARSQRIAMRSKTTGGSSSKERP